MEINENMKTYENLCNTMTVLRWQEASLESSKSFYWDTRPFFTVSSTHAAKSMEIHTIASKSRVHWNLCKPMKIFEILRTSTNIYEILAILWNHANRWKSMEILWNRTSNNTSLQAWQVWVVFFREQFHPQCGLTSIIESSSAGEIGGRGGSL